MTPPREKGSETPSCTCQDEASTEECPVHPTEASRRETAAASVRELGS